MQQVSVVIVLKLMKKHLLKVFNYVSFCTNLHFEEKMGFVEVKTSVNVDEN